MWDKDTKDYQRIQNVIVIYRVSDNNISCDVLSISLQFLVAIVCAVGFGVDAEM